MTKVYYQRYFIHLLDGSQIEMYENYHSKKDEFEIAKWFEIAQPEDVLTVDNGILGVGYIPKRSILYLEENGVTSETFYDESDGMTSQKKNMKKEA